MMAVYRVASAVLGAVHRDQRGATAVEFALVFPILLMMMALIMETGQAIWVQNLMQLGCDEAARYAAANPSATTSQITDVAEGMLTITSDTPAFTVTLTAASPTAPAFASCSATYDYPIRIPMVSQGLTTVTMTASTRMAMIQ